MSANMAILKSPEGVQKANRKQLIALKKIKENTIRQKFTGSNKASPVRNNNL